MQPESLTLLKSFQTTEYARYLAEVSGAERGEGSSSVRSQGRPSDFTRMSTNSNRLFPMSAASSATSKRAASPPSHHDQHLFQKRLSASSDAAATHSYPV